MNRFGLLQETSRGIHSGMSTAALALVTVSTSIMIALAFWAIQVKFRLEPVASPSPEAAHQNELTLLEPVLLKTTRYWSGQAGVMPTLLLFVLLSLATLVPFALLGATTTALVGSFWWLVVIWFSDWATSLEDLGSYRQIRRVLAAKPGHFDGCDGEVLVSGKVDADGAVLSPVGREPCVLFEWHASITLDEGSESHLGIGGTNFRVRGSTGLTLDVRLPPGSRVCLLAARVKRSVTGPLTSPASAYLPNIIRTRTVEPLEFAESWVRVGQSVSAVGTLRQTSAGPLLEPGSRGLVISTLTTLELRDLARLYGRKLSLFAALATSATVLPIVVGWLT